MYNNTLEKTNLTSITRTINAKVEFYTGSTLATTYYNTDNLISISIERSCDQGKYFGFGICQKATVQILDTDREIDLSNYDSLKIYLTTTTSYNSYFPKFVITDVKRDENTNNLTIESYDVLYNSSKSQVSELGLVAPYTIANVATSAATKLGLTLDYDSTNLAFATSYNTGANLEGTETLRSILDDIAEATQTIYYISGNKLKFKKLTAQSILIIGKADYFTLKSQPSHTIAKIVSATELGDNVSATTGGEGDTQYVRDNPFWELRTDIATIVENAVTNIGGLTIIPYECQWRGNYLLELGDCITIVAKDNSSITTFLLGETLTYNGGLTSKISWTYPTNTSETESNPSTLGEVLNQTYARVDKANKQIDLVVSKVDGYDSKISQIQLDQKSITATVSNVSSRQDTTDSEIDNITQKVNASITSNQAELIVQEELSKGVNKVTTTTGFTFNQNGLTISKSNVDITTNISEDGMRVSKDGQVVLTADNNGVEALNLHASTYLIIGENSRFEDYDNGSRTGCFWIGG